MALITQYKDRLWSASIGGMILILPILIAYPALNAPYYYDDFQNISANLWVMNFEPTIEYLSAYFQEESFTRFIAIYSFGLDHYLHGGVLAYMRAENIIFHSMSGLMLWGVVVQLNRLRGWGVSSKVLGVGALLWAIHPFMLDTPIYLVQRMAVLAALFSLMAYWFWNRGWESSQGKWRWFLGAAGCLVVAIASKENATLMIPLAVLDAWLLRRAIAGRALVVLLAVTVLALYGLGNWAVQGSIVDHMIKAYDGRYFTMEERLFTEARILWIYLWVFLFPVPDQLAFYLEPVLSKGLFEPWTTLWAVLAHIGLFGLGVWGVLKNKRWLAFAVFGYFLLHSLESSFIPLQLAFEHRMYLPGAFLFLVVWGPMLRAWTQARLLRRSLEMILAAAFIVLLGIIGQQRAFEWSYPLLFWEEQTHRTPQLSWAWNDYAAVLQRVGRIDEAREASSRAVQLQPEDMFLLANRMMFCMQWDHGEGLETWWSSFAPLLKKPKIAGGYRMAMEKFSKDLVDAHEYDKALAILKMLQRVDLSPTSVLILAQLYHDQGEFADEEGALKRGIDAFPGNPAIVEGLAVFLVRDGRRAEALAVLASGRNAAGKIHNRQFLEQRYQSLVEEESAGLVKGAEGGVAPGSSAQ